MAGAIGPGGLKRDGLDRPELTVLDVMTCGYVLLGFEIKYR